MLIKIKKQDILDYITGKTQYDAIEKIIDPLQYEIYDCGIYDNRAQKMLKQSKEYEIYCAAVTNLRKRAPEMTKWEIEKLCLEISEIAPTEIVLDDSKN